MPTRPCWSCRPGASAEMPTRPCYHARPLDAPAWLLDAPARPLFAHHALLVVATRRGGPAGRGDPARPLDAPARPLDALAGQSALLTVATL